jgi:uncharacterized protein YdaU (DUF1376 family)
MAELPYMQFYPADYLRDTEILSLSAQGGWMRMLCSMWHPARRGVLSLRLQAMARLLHASEQATKGIIDEIEDCDVGIVEWSDDGERVTVTCRRMVRDWSTLSEARSELSDKRSEAARARWEKHRQSSGNADGLQAPCKSNASAEQVQCYPETRSQIGERDRGRDELFSQQAHQIAEAYPRREKIAEALTIILRHLRDGESFETMLAGTRACAAVIRTLPSGAKNRFVPGAEAFFRDRRWLDDPETLSRQGDTKSGGAKMEMDDALKQLGGRAAALTQRTNETT